MQVIPIGSLHEADIDPQRQHHSETPMSHLHIDMLHNLANRFTIFLCYIVISFPTPVILPMYHAVLVNLQLYIELVIATSIDSPLISKTRFKKRPASKSEN